MVSKKKLVAAGVVAALLSAVLAVPASADDKSNNSTPGLTVTAGSGPRFDTAVSGDTTHPLLDYPTVGNFNSVTLNGTPQLTAAEIAPFTVIDDSGSGVGWSVTLHLPNFTDAATDVLSAAGAQMNAPVVAAANATSPMGGVWSNPVTDFTTAAKIVDADPTDTTHNGGAPLGPDGVTKVAGMGSYLISPQILKLVVPANAKAGVYSTTATIAITNTP